MRVIDNYNELINTIEKTVNTPPYLSAMESEYKIAKSTGYDGRIRDLNAVFSFLTDMSLLNYIKGRKMNLAYKTLIEQEKFDVQEAIDISGFDNQSSFGKAFKNQFEVSPKVAHRQKENSKLQEPLFWNCLDKTNSTIAIEDEGDSMVDTGREMSLSNDAVLGINMDLYKKIVQLQEMCAIYNCGLEHGEVAYEIAEKYNVSLEKAFEYVIQFRLVSREEIEAEGIDSYYFDDDPDKPATIDDYNPKAQLMSRVDDEELIYACIQCGLSVHEAGYVAGKLEFAPEDIGFTSLSKIMVYACVHSDSVFSHIKKAVDYYMAHSKEQELDYDRFDYYLEKIDENMPIQTAFQEAEEYITEEEWDGYIQDVCSGKVPIEMEMTLDDILDEMAERRGENYF